MADNSGGLDKVFHGFFAIPALGTLGDLGLADAWSKGEVIHVEAMCAERNFDAQLILPMARYFVLYGYLQETDGRFVATPMGREVFALWPAAMVFQAYAPMFAELPGLIRGQKKYGYGESIYRDMRLDTKASGAMGIRWGLFQRVAGYAVKQNHQKILDLGCGDGTFLRYACEQFSGLQAVGVDQSEVALEGARANFKAAQLEGRGTFFTGDLMRPADFLARPEVKDVNVVTIFYILHEIAWSGLDTVRAFLREYRKHLGGVKLAVTEYYRPAAWKGYMDRAVPEVVLYHDISKQRLMERQQWYALYEEAGFRITDTLEVTGAAVPPTIGTAILEA